ncbi:hypothetical protein MMC09_006916 [Bachmanniomyces sp. S44760]|nr:hypothetical protein [Bachmanniomyces sp. S44760]
MAASSLLGRHTDAPLDSSARDFVFGLRKVERGIETLQKRTPSSCTPKHSKRYPKLLGRNGEATIVGIDDTKHLEFESGQKGEIKTDGLCGCTAVVVASIKVGILGHYNDEDDEGPEKLEEAIVASRSKLSVRKKPATKHQSLLDRKLLQRSPWEAGLSYQSAGSTHRPASGNTIHRFGTI